MAVAAVKSLPPGAGVGAAILSQVYLKSFSPVVSDAALNKAVGAVSVVVTPASVVETEKEAGTSVAHALVKVKLATVPTEARFLKKLFYLK